MINVAALGGCPECLQGYDLHLTGCPNDYEYWRNDQEEQNAGNVQRP